MRTITHTNPTDWAKDIYTRFGGAERVDIRTSSNETNPTLLAIFQASNKSQMCVGKFDTIKKVGNVIDRRDKER